jgi:DNA repair exonuclease SbcCD ATPase subunit
MGVAILKKSTGGDDPRWALREAICAAAEAQRRVEEHREAIRRAHAMVSDTEQKLATASDALEAARSGHAEVLVRAATTGHVAKPNGALRTARLALVDVEDEVSAAKAALERLKADGEEIEASISKSEDAVFVAIAAAVAPVAEQVLERILRARGELLALQAVFDALTESQEEPVLLSSGQFARRVDPRLAPLNALRTRLSSLGPEEGRAQDIVAAFQKWRAALAHDPDAMPPED